jgi:hypothetical protein
MAPSFEIIDIFGFSPFGSLAMNGHRFCVMLQQ